LCRKGFFGYGMTFAVSSSLPALNTMPVNGERNS
jgi:hypothetical protein